MQVLYRNNEVFGFLLKGLFVLCLLPVNPWGLSAQNLVPNFSFESTTSCQNDFAGPGPGGTPAIPWVMPTVGSPDIFNTCAVSLFVDVPVNLIGNQSPITGENYAGFQVRYSPYEYREYIQAPLIQPLVGGTWYYVSFYVSPCESKCAIEHIGAYFSSNPVSSSQFTHLMLTPQVESDQGFLDDYDNWILISGCFQATGGEAYITIGNFGDDPSTPVNPGCPPPLDAYYYLEDVSVIETVEPGEIIFDLGGPYTDCDSYEIDPGIPDVYYLWENGSTLPSLVVTESGTYSLTITDECSFGIDSVEIFIGGSAPPLNIDPNEVFLCEGESYTVSLDPSLGDYQWQDGSTDTEYTITTTGTYSVTLDDGCSTSADNINVTFSAPPPPFSLGEDGPLCVGESLLLSLNPDLGTFAWQDNSTNSFYSVTESGTYTVTISNECGEANDEIVFTELVVPDIDLGDDQYSLCTGEVLLFEFDPDLGDFLWQDGSTSPFYEINSAGIYSLTVSNLCGSALDQVDISYFFYPDFDLGPDIVLCDGDTVVLSAPGNEGDYLWQDTSTSTMYIVVGEGTYMLTLTNACGVGEDTINITSAPAIIPPDLGADFSLCPGESTVLFATAPGASYLWSNATTADSLFVNSPGVYSVEVFNNCNSYSDTVVVIVNDNPPQVNLPDQLTLCQGQTLTLDAAISGVSFLWNDNSINQQLAVSSPGTYSVTVTNACGGDIDTTIILDGGPAPVVDIGNDLQICAGDVIPLSPSFLNVDAWIWNDGSTLPSFSVSSAGIVNVQVNNTCGVAFDTMLVSLLPATPPLDLGSDTSLCAGEQFILSINTPGVAVLWPDGSNANDFIVDNPGLVFASITNACGSSFDTLEVFPLPDIPSLNLGPDQSLCPGEIITLSPGIPDVSYLWQDGSTNSAYQSSQEENIILIISNSCGSTADTLEIMESTQGPQVDLGPDIQVCQGEIVNIASNISGVNYLWQDGSSAPDFSTAVSGTFILAVSNNCGVDSDTIAVDISGVAPSPFLGPDTTLCEGLSLVLLSSADPITSVLWQDGSSSPSFLVTSPGTFILAESNRCGDASDTIVVSFFDAPDPFSLGPDTSLCPGETLILSAPSGSFNIMWQDGSAAPFFTVTSPGNYSLTESNRCGQASDNIVVSFLNAPDPFSLGPDTTLCPGETIVLSAPSVSFDIMWQDGSSAPQFVADRAGTYVLQLSNDCGAVSDQLEVSFDTRIPVIDLDPSIPWCYGDIISLDVSQPFTATYLWSTGDNSSAIEIETPGIYTIDVSTPCSSATQIIDIYASADCGGITINNSIYLPNVFSPNGDGINDVFSVSYGPDLDVTGMKGAIFDRWGNLVFSSQDIPFAWDGFFAGEILMPGVFVYTVTIKFFDDGEERERVFSGDVTLVR